MAQSKQLNVRVPEKLATQISRVTRFHGKSINDWVVSTLEEKVQTEYREHQLEKLERKLAQVARIYLPGRVVSLDEMLAFADTFVNEDTRDGLNSRHLKKPRPRKPGTRRAR